MKITHEPDLAHWPAVLLDQPRFPYSHYIEGAQHTPHGTVEILSWEADPNTLSKLQQAMEGSAPLRREYHSPAEHGELVHPAAAEASSHAAYTRLRMVVAGKGWLYEDECHYPPDRLTRIANAFAALAIESAGVQQRVSDGAGMVTQAIKFSRELDRPAPFGSLQPTEC